MKPKTTLKTTQLITGFSERFKLPITPSVLYALDWLQDIGADVVIMRHTKTEPMPLIRVLTEPFIVRIDWSIFKALEDRGFIVLEAGLTDGRSAKKGKAKWKRACFKVIDREELERFFKKYYLHIQEMRQNKDNSRIMSQRGLDRRLVVYQQNSTGNKET